MDLFSIEDLEEPPILTFLSFHGFVEYEGFEEPPSWHSYLFVDLLNIEDVNEPPILTFLSFHGFAEYRGCGRTSHPNILIFSWICWVYRIWKNISSWHSYLFMDLLSIEDVEEPPILTFLSFHGFVEYRGCGRTSHPDILIFSWICWV